MYAGGHLVDDCVGVWGEKRQQVNDDGYFIYGFRLFKALFSGTWKMGLV